jgi:hypothetical protein
MYQSIERIVLFYYQKCYGSLPESPLYSPDHYMILGDQFAKLQINGHIADQGGLKELSQSVGNDPDIERQNGDGEA